MEEIHLIPTVQKPLFRLPPRSSLALPSFVSDFIKSLSRPQKIVIVSIGTGLALIGLVARYLRRRRRTPRKSAMARHDDSGRSTRKLKPITICSPSGVHSVGGNISPGFHRSVHRQSFGSVGSDRATVASVLTTQAADGSTLTPQQYGVMGMEALETALGFWEDALAAYTAGVTGGVALTSQEEAEFTALLQRVIDDSYSLQDQCEHLFLHQHSVLFRSTSVTPVPSEVTCETFDRRTITSASSYESFVSASGDIADLRDLEEFDEAQYPLYMAALKQHEEGGIPFRDIRSDRVRCGSDVEYICKVHCIRLACQLLFSQEETKVFFANSGRQIIGNLLARADKDPKDVVQAYEEMLVFLDSCDWAAVEAELLARGVKALTFYDVVLDFILMDAFEDLENPPSSVTAVVQNRWLSNGFKESALSTAVWSVLRAKRRMLKYQDGFISHFYDISEHLSPVLAWGFLGPDENIKELCTFFKEQIVGLLQDIFSFTSVRYTTVEELAADIMILTTQRFENISKRLAL
ncbi:mitoguardin isoform X2 [Procambarus clarkii]|uniref:mitoguardin isoform X2 n=1 Tax=Procambarus clarkii TaxID=6728 RepID=UPI001E671F07|nr:mitoguardin-like isoform X2 [Procambarus clarkii]